MGLNHPADLEAWKAWQRARNPARAAKERLFRPRADAPVLLARGSAPEVLIALDAAKPTSVASLAKPLRFMSGRAIAVLAPANISDQLPGTGWQSVALSDGALPDVLQTVRVVAGGGHYMRVGGTAYRWARAIGAPYNAVQHGLVTPHAPPLPREAHLLAFSEADADFWRSGRTDITVEVVGSQLLWSAHAASEAAAVSSEARPVFLGQLHGAELLRSQFARAAQEFCGKTGALYRPHPSETDKMSRLQHALWERKGMSIDRSGQPLATLNVPVASVFSTGILEAAARGLPAWATHPSPPLWLEEFWERYGMSRWGQDPTPTPERPNIEPARAIALALERQLEGPA